MQRPFLFILLFALILFSNERIFADEVKMDFYPEWAKNAVWYQIFPDRFRNGDPNNDPQLKDIKGSWPHDHTSPWQVHPWTSDWYELQPYEKLNGKDIWFNIQRRRYGGDIKGIMDKLDYLQDLGVNAIYLNPVFVSPSLHKYDGEMYHHIDPNFGPDPEGDRKLIASETPDDPSTWKWTKADLLMLNLIKEIHKRKMKIIFDGVFNHIGINNPFFQDVKKNQQNSKYKDWFVVKKWDDPKTGDKFEYEGWFGVKELPEWREDENGIVAGPKKYIFDSTKRWMDPNNDGNTSDGIDGWRLDVAFCVKHPFWKDWSKLVKSINSDAYMTAEIIDTVKANKSYLEGDEFTAVMNYNFAFASTQYFINNKESIKTSEFDKLLKELRDAYDSEVSYEMQNLLDSHDTARVATHIVNRDKFIFRNWSDYCRVSQEKNGIFDVRKPDARELAVQKLIAIFQMTYVGAPMIYYGDEAGMWGCNDPDCRKPMVWENMKYYDEVYLPDQTKREHPDKVEFNKDLFSFYKKLINIRNDNEALRTGDFKTLITDDKNQVYGFQRTTKNKRIIVLLNNSDQPQTVEIKFRHIVEFSDMLNNNKEYKLNKGIVSVTIKPLWGCILLEKQIASEKQ
jgi:glycosidase